MEAQTRAEGKGDRTKMKAVLIRDVSLEIVNYRPCPGFTTDEGILEINLNF
jgi:hypothetical protein